MTSVFNLERATRSHAPAAAAAAHRTARRAIHCALLYYTVHYTFEFIRSSTVVCVRDIVLRRAAHIGARS